LEIRDICYGCVVGAFIGDACGAPLEFQYHIPSEKLEQAINMGGGGCFATGPGQITDDSELAISLAHALANANGVLDIAEITKYFAKWMDSPPFGFYQSSFLHFHYRYWNYHQKFLKIRLKRSFYCPTSCCQ
jgi:ADP-ribosylglycohydrolase